MPKHNRSASGHPSHYAQMASGLPSPLYSQQRVAIPASYYTIPGAPSSSMSQQLASQQQSQAQASFDPAAVAAASSYTTTTDPSAAAAATITAIPPGQHRPSSGAWSPQDDHQLVNARMQGLNWGQIKDTYFPAKTANACRKRHERLMERKGSDDWDGRKLQRLAKEYMGMRREIWSGLAARTGEKWSVVEQKVRFHCLLIVSFRGSRCCPSSVGLMAASGFPQGVAVPLTYTERATPIRRMLPATPPSISMPFFTPFLFRYTHTTTTHQRLCATCLHIQLTASVHVQRPQEPPERRPRRLAPRPPRDERLRALSHRV